MSLFQSIKDRVSSSSLPALPALPVYSPPDPLEVFKRPMFYAATPFRALPSQLQCLLLRQILEHVLGNRIADGDFDCLISRRVKINVVDMNLAWEFGLSPQRNILVSSHTDPDTEIRGDALSFMQIATRSVDPDTLFFQRRLMILGDTELGHEVKNLMDSIDMEHLPRPLQSLFNRWCQRVIKAHQWSDKLGQALQYRVPLQQADL
ncbi:ubiquinone anaerobic biosynthesis accessory factor UbiT [Hahella ganghwensis]|uniref:ubiquinone anaerobic biosynthesis accessory factor UbiT n=1 Tax=Hahella ganghwensis TaxID=286420 RepID=UPI000371A744|nr:SCP2 sterol-binding domain-containing protein [Hahella ganghwensis]